MTMADFLVSRLPRGSKIHMVGIGGISMSAIAHILLYLGFSVSGSDMNNTPIIEKLSAEGVKIFHVHSEDNIQSPDLVCYTAAIKQDNPELVRARELGIPTMERAELLGQIMTMFDRPVAIAGTHGKTTTSSMLALIALEAGTDPTVLVGGELSQIGGNYKIGKNDLLICEACEYVESFLHFKPFLSIITNIEEDHPDYFSDIYHIISSFEKFASLNSKKGFIIVYKDDKNVRTVMENVEANYVTYGLNSGDADFTAKNIKYNKDGCPSFDIYGGNDKILSVSLGVVGEHNICNALASTAAALKLGIGADAIKRGLELFGGAKRRYEHIGSFNGVDVVDDYAHHPTEIKKTLEAAKNAGYKRVFCVFQPHTYSRTVAFLDDFADALKIADRIIIADIYPAREKYDGTVHSCDLAALIKGSVYMNDFGAIERYVKNMAQEGDLVLTMGAGDIFKVGYALVK